MHEPVGRARFQKTEAFGAAPDLCGRVRTYAMRTLVDLARHFVLCGLATGCGTAARSKAQVMRRRS